MLGKGVGRRALRLTSLSFPVEEEICNTGLSHGQKGGWGNEDYARLRSFLVWETVFAHKRSCGRTQLALKLIIKQTFVCRSVSALKYRLRSNGTSSKGLTEATLKEHRMQWISAHICVLGGGYVEAICLLAEKKNCLTVSLIRSTLFCFLFSFSCGYGYLLISENAVTHN